MIIILLIIIIILFLWRTGRIGGPKRSPNPYEQKLPNINQLSGLTAVNVSNSAIGVKQYSLTIYILLLVPKDQSVKKTCNAYVLPHKLF